MSIQPRTSEFMRRGLMLRAALSTGLMVFMGAGVAVMSAQTQGDTASQSGAAVGQAVVAAEPALNLKVPVADGMSSSSNSLSDEASVATDPLHLNAMQYGGRPRYGRPRYRGGNTNPDGSNKWTFYGGAGFTQPTGNTWHYLTPSYGIQVGFGRQYSKHFALPIEFDWDNFGFTGQTLYNQESIYNYQINYYNNSLVGGTSNPNAVAPLTALDGTSHVWSFSIDPTYTLYSGEGFGAYVLAGVGFYHKVATFTTPGVGTYCDYYGYCYQYEANQVIDHYSSNAPGFSAGFGLTYKLSHFSNERLYGEVRYVFVDNSQRYGVTAATITSANVYAANDYPANSNRTTYIPVKFGVRF